MGMYQPLSLQQQLVLSWIAYNDIIGTTCREKIKNEEDLVRFLRDGEREHLVSNETQESICGRLRGAKCSGKFSEFFVQWSKEGEILGIFGVLKNPKKISMDRKIGRWILLCEPIDWIGEWTMDDTPIPSYRARLMKARARYRSFLPARAIILLWFLIGVYCLLRIGFSGFLTFNIYEGIFVVILLMGCPLILALCSFHRYRVLYS